MKNAMVSVSCGFLGAFLFSLFTTHAIPEAKAGLDKPITGTSFNLVDGAGKLRAQIGFSKQGPYPGFWILDENGKARIAMGLYEDSTAHIGLQDKSGNMIQLLRAFGPKEAPLHIWKTNATDMMIMGLNPTSNPTPFLMSYEENRSRKIHFGKYEGP